MRGAADLGCRFLDSNDTTRTGLPGVARAPSLAFLFVKQIRVDQDWFTGAPFKPSFGLSGELMLILTLILTLF